MQELSELIAPHIPKSDALEALCLEPKWTEKQLCRLKNFVMETDKEKTRDHILEAAGARKWLMSETAPEKEADSLIVIIKGKDGKYLIFSLPQSFGEKKTFVVEHQGKKYTFEAVPKTNGYNTEYIIKDSSGNTYEQMALLFSATNPAWKLAKGVLDKLRGEIRSLEEKIHSLSSQIERKKKEKSKKKGQSLATLREEKSRLEKVLQGKKKELVPAQKELQKYDRYIDFPYTPYNQIADTPAMQEQGYHYLTQSLEKAWDDDALGKVRSFVGTREPLPETYPHEIALVLNIVERMDFKTYFLNSGNLKPRGEIDAIMRSQIHKALTTFALNGNNAFNWQRSGVGALGVGQFMPSTYAGLQKNYPGVVGNRGFEEGAKDHITSFKMQGLHFHEESRAFPEEIKKSWNTLMQDDESRLGMYALIAAGYNGSIKRVIRESLSGSSDIKTLLHPDTLEKTLANNPETLTYVMKFIFVWKYLKATYHGFDEK